MFNYDTLIRASLSLSLAVSAHRHLGVNTHAFLYLTLSNPLKEKIAISGDGAIPANLLHDTIGQSSLVFSFKITTSNARICVKKNEKSHSIQLILPKKT